MAEDAQTWFAQGVSFYEKGDYQRAIAAFDKAIACDPALAEVWNNRGLAFIQLGNYQEAHRSIQKALNINPRYQNAQKARQVVLGLMKDQNEALSPSPAGTAPPCPPAEEETKTPAVRRSVLVPVVVVILVVIAGAIVVTVRSPGSSGFAGFFTPTPTPTPIPTPIQTPTPVPVTIIPTPTPVVIPSSGTWVEVKYDKYYSGTFGTPASQQVLSGGRQMVPNTGDQFYLIPTNNGFITASVSKNDGSGDTLTVNMYQDGTLVETDSTSTPYGVLDVVARIPVTPINQTMNTSAIPVS